MAASSNNDYFSGIAPIGISAVAEPSIVALFGLGLFGLGLSRRRLRS